LDYFKLAWITTMKDEFTTPFAGLLSRILSNPVTCRGDKSPILVHLARGILEIGMEADRPNRAKQMSQL
jgi:hypothetical protein